MNRPIRVAHVVGTTGASGVESHLLALFPSFDPAEVRPTLFVQGPGIMVDRMKALGGAVEFGAPTRKLAFMSVPYLARRWRGAFDLIHVHGPRVTFWAAPAARMAGIPMIASVHELRWRTMVPSLKRDLWVELEGFALRRADHVIAVSHIDRHELSARWPSLRERITAVHATAPMLLHPEAIPRAIPGRVGGPLRLVAVARLVYFKAYDLLFPALAKLVTAGVDFVLSIVGTGELDSELRRASASLGLEERIRWLGRDVDVPALLAESDIFVTATRSEMFGIAVLEAMAVGLPVLATAVGSLPELIEDGVSGRLVSGQPEREVPERIAAELIRLARDPDERIRLGEAAAARARSFSPSAFAQGTTSVYRTVLGARR